MFHRQRRPPRPAPAPPARVPAGVAVLVDEFNEREFAQAFGEFTVRRPAEPPPPAVQPFVIEPPDWAEEQRLRGDQPASDDPEPSMTPVQRMMAAAADRGELEEPAALGPPISYGPLEPIRPEPPDWNLEEKQAIRRNARERLEHARQLVDRDEHALAEHALAEEQPARHPPPERRSA